jgi:ATP-binding cassette, subfamily C, bacteriocin exporter
MIIDKKHIEKSFVRQHDQSDCGVACMTSVIQYFGGSAKLEKLRELSGTTKQGTTLLGLYQAAPEVGLTAKALEADGLDNLTEVEMPVILHVVLENKLQHYMVCYGQKNGKYILGDPGKGIIELGTNELEAIWLSKALLTLGPTENFIKNQTIKADKKLWLLDLIREDIPLLTIALVIGVIIAVLGMTTALFSQKLIDDILPAKDTERLVLGLVLLLILLLARGGMGYLRGFFLIRQSKDLNIRMIKQFYDALLYLPKRFFDTRKTGELVARMNDTRRIQSTISFVLGNIVIDALVIVVAIVFVMVYSWPVGLVVTGGLPVYLLIIWYYNAKIIKAQKEVMQSYAMNESNYVDTIQGMGTIKSMNKQKMFSKITNTIYGFFQDKIFDLGKLNIRYGWVSETTGILVIISVFGLASWLVLQDTLKIGEMVAVLSMSGSVIPSVNRLAIANVQIKEAKVAFDRMYEFASITPEFDKNDNKEEVIEKFEMLSIEALDFRFPGRKRLLENINMEISRGEIIALLGESGSGKSTILQIVQKFYAPENGEIIINQTTNWQSVNHQEWRKLLAVVPQEIKIFSGSLLDNICLGNAQEEAKAIIAFCEEYGFDSYFKEFPQHYLTLLGEEGVNISGGQQQLVALARALYQNPQLLLLDEATSAMDRKMEQFVLGLLNKIKGDTTIIIVTHRFKPAKIANRIYILEEGTVKHQGSPAELMNSRNLYSDSVLENTR